MKRVKKIVVEIIPGTIVLVSGPVVYMTGAVPIITLISVPPVVHLLPQAINVMPV
jgi:hypothetical protein